MQIRYWFDGYTPELALDADPIVAILHQPKMFEVRKENEKEFRLPKEGARVMDIGDWMRENGYQITDRKLVGQRRRPYWQGQYVIEIKKEMKK